jgi:hypothetical protein
MADDYYQVRINFDTREEADSFIQKKKLSKTPYTLHRIDIHVFIVIAINGMDEKIFKEFKTFTEAHDFITESVKLRKIKEARIQEMTVKQWREMQPEVQAQRQYNFRKIADWLGRY